MDADPVTQRFSLGDRGFRNDRLLPGVTLQFDYDIEEERYEANFQYIRRFSDQWRTRAGFGYYQERVRRFTSMPTPR